MKHSNNEFYGVLSSSNQGYGGTGFDHAAIFKAYGDEGGVSINGSHLNLGQQSKWKFIELDQARIDAARKVLDEYRLNMISTKLIPKMVAVKLSIQ